MRFNYHPFSSLFIGLAVWLSLLALRPMLQEQSFLLEGGIIIGAAALTGTLLALLRSPRGITLLVQLLVVAGVTIWRGLTIAPMDGGLREPLMQLTTLGWDAIRVGTPPLEPSPGLLWLLMLMTALLVLVMELLVNGLEQPAWAIAPLALPFGIGALVIREDLPWTVALPVIVGFLLVLASSTGAPGRAVGNASKAFAHVASRAGTALIIGALGFGLALAVAPLLPLGEKQPWSQAGPDGPIELSDPTVRLEEDLRRPNDRLLFTYRSSADEPTYLRTVALPELTTGGARLLPMRLSRFGMEGAYDFPGVEVEVNVQMAGVPSEYLPAPFAVDSVDADGDWSYDPDTMSVIASGAERLQQTVDLEYSVRSTVPNASLEDIEAASAGSPADEVTSLVPEGLAPGVEEITESVVTGAETDGQKALAIQRWLRSEAFDYTLDAPNSMGTDAISSFLLQDRAGYCIHFAAAMITMARMEGIPARMAIGFTPGELQGDGTYQVTSHDAHAWPELYFEGLGWMPFEPTPPFAGPTDYTDAPAPADSPSATPSAQPSTASPSPSQQPSPSPSPTPTAQPTPVVGGGQAWLPWFLGILGVLALLALPALIRLAVRAWRLRPGQPAGDGAEAAWREVMAGFVDHGVTPPKGSPVPAAQAAADALPEPAAAALLEVARVVERSRYAREGSLGSSGEALGDQVRAVRSGIAEGATTQQKLRATLLPPSLFDRALLRG